MTKEQLYEQISTRKSTLLKELNLPTDEYLDFIIEFNKENNLRNPDTCLNVNLDNLFYCAMLTLTYPNHLELVKMVHEEKNDLFSKRSIGETELLIDQLELIYMVLKAQESIGGLNLKDPESIRAHINKALRYGKSIISEEKMGSFSNVVILKCLAVEEFDEAISLVAKVRNFSVVIEEARKYVGNHIITNMPEVKRKFQDRVLKGRMNDLYKYDGLDKSINKFYRKLEEIKEMHRARVKQKNYQQQQLLSYEKFKKDFDKLLTGDEIISYEDFTKYLDEDIKVLVLTMINEHNQNCYKKLTTTLSPSNLQTGIILSKFGIKKSDYNYDEISKFSPDELNEILTNLTNLGIKTPLTLLEIIRATTKESVQLLSKYIKKDIIKAEFVANHPMIFDASSDIYNSVISNITTTIDNNISLNYIGCHQEVLLIPPQRFLASINTLEEYGLKKQLTTSTSSTLLEEVQLAEKLDMIIELGYEKTLQSNLNLAAYPFSSWQKIILLRHLGFEIEEEQLEDMLINKTFVVDETEINNYLYQPLSKETNEKLNSTLVPNVSVSNPLEIYATSNLSYNIGTQIVSRPKVIRNLKKLSLSEMIQEEKLLLSVANNMSLTYEEFINLKQILDPENVVKPTALCYNKHHL